MNRHLTTLFLSSFAFILSLTLYGVGINLQPGELADPDCYMRLVQIQELLDTKEWYNHISERSNAPYGEELHWTRPLDIFLLLLAIPFSLFLDFSDALFWSGVLFSPLLIFPTLFALLSLYRPFLNSRDTIHLYLLFLCQPGIIFYYLAGRADHHALLLTVFLFCFYTLFRIIDSSGTKRTALLAGALHAFALWLSIESMVFCFLSQFVLGIFWLKGHRHLLSSLFYFSLGLTGGILFALLIERPFSNWMVPEYDKISVVHASLFGYISLFWIIPIFFSSSLSKLIEKNIFSRIFFSFIGGIGFLALVITVFPDFLKGPFSKVGPKLVDLLIRNTSEVQPLVHSWKEIPSRLAIWLGPLVPCLILLPYFLKQKPLTASEQKILSIISIGLLLYLPLSFYQIRWLPYASALLIFPYTLLLSHLLSLLESKLKDPWIRLARVLTILAFCSGNLFFGLLIKNSPSPSQPPHSNSTANTPDSSPPSSRDISLVPLCHYLNQNYSHPVTILAFTNYGPELLYRTPHHVLATPYHRNASGNLTSHTILSSESAEQIKSLLQKRNIHLILLSSDPTEAAFFHSTSNSRTLYRKLQSNELPSWIKPHPLPDTLNKQFSLFEVQLKPISEIN